MKMRSIALAIILIALAVCTATAAPWLSGRPLTEAAMIQLRGLEQDVNGFSFVVVGDTRSWIRFQQPETFRQIVREANALNPAFVIDVGDLLSTGNSNEPDMRRMWDGFIEVVRTSRVPFFPVVGNHDVSAPFHERLWAEYAGPLWYSFDYGGCHFVALDSMPQTATAALDKEQLEWLKKDLAAAKARHVFVFLHHPIFADSPAWKPVHEVLRQYPTRAVFAGHVHLYRRYPDVDGIRYYITGGGGAEIGSDPKAGSFHNYMIVSVRGGEVSETVVRPGNILPTDILDTGSPEQQAYLYNRLDYKESARLGGVLAANLADIKDPALVRDLADTAASGDFNGRPLALATIARLKQPELFDALAKLVGGDDAELKVAAIDAVSRIAGPGWNKVIEPAVGDCSPEVRQRATEVLGNAGLFHPVGTELVAEVPLTWRAAPDPKDAGVRQGWYQDKFDDSKWVEVVTNRRWYEQGGDFARPANPICWGRVRFTVDEKWRGRYVILRFGELEWEANVYLNGKQVLVRNVDSYTPKGPIEIEATDSLRFGGSNLLVIRGVPRGGATGVSKPASLYTAPTAPK